MKTTSRKPETIHWNKGVREAVIACGISAAHTSYSVEHRRVTCKTCLKCIEASKGNQKQITPPHIQSKKDAELIHWNIAIDDSFHAVLQCARKHIAKKWCKDPDRVTCPECRMVIDAAQDVSAKLFDAIRKIETGREVESTYEGKIRTQVEEITDLNKTNDEMQKTFAQKEIEWKAAMYDRDVVCTNAQEGIDRLGIIIGIREKTIADRDHALGMANREIDRLEKINKTLLPDMPIFLGQKFAEAYAKEIQNPIGMVRDIPDDYGIAKLVGELTLKLKETTTALNQANESSSKKQDEQKYLEKLNYRLKLRFLNLAKAELIRAEKAQLISDENLREYWFDDEVNLRVEGYWINISPHDSALIERALMMVRAGKPEDQPAVMPCAIVKNYANAIGWIERKKAQDAQDKEQNNNGMVSHPETTDPLAQGDPGTSEGC